MATYDVAGRSAIVTGSASGIGRAVAHTLAASGASVLVVDMREDSIQKVVEEIRAAGGVAEGFVGDVTDTDSVEASIAAANKLAPLRIAVNNAGIGGPAVPVGAAAASHGTPSPDRPRPTRSGSGCPSRS